MSRRSVATPCPVPNTFDNFPGATLDETTSTFNFTTEIRASFRDARPRRRQRQSVQFAIHEDEAEPVMKSTNAQTTLFKPPRRLQNIASLPNAASSEQLGQSSNDPSSSSKPKRLSNGSRVSQAPKRPKSRLSVLPESAIQKSATVLQSPPTETIRPVRRGTIYIPNEDTTMPTMYMGVFSPIKDLHLPTGSIRDDRIPEQMTGIGAQMAQKKGPRKSLVQSAPRRRALQLSSRLLQQSKGIVDRFGQGGGKENVPPGCLSQVKESQSFAGAVQSRIGSTTITMKSESAVSRSSVYASTTSSLQRCERQKSIPLQSTRPVWNSGPKPRSPIPITVPCTSLKPTTPSVTTSVAPAKTVKRIGVPSRLVVPAVQQGVNMQHFAILPEDIKDPTVYEENWLSHQEIVLTQLVNNLFTAAKDDSSQGYRTIRRQLLEIYCSSSIVLMHKRIQAALLYGALSIPQNVLDQGSRLQTDLGLRKRFTDLWLETYDLEVLETALEVVIGRECRSHQWRSSSCGAVLSKPSKSGLRKFIETFLIRNEDSKPETATNLRNGWGYHRAVLRSLLLIKILDLTKSEHSIRLRGCLFQPSSLFKTSVAVVQALVQMLNPAAGDPVKALKHVDYIVSHTQYPLEEFEYGIENIAIDLRDGVRLTRLVELLLYPSSSALDKQTDAGTTTVLMPEGELLDFENGQDWPLSRHLKMPCQSRIVKLWNVQLAISAMKNVKGVDVVADGITADDIVDGFREKTIRLLWGLAGKSGLYSLLNWQDVGWEVRRLERNTKLLNHEDPCYDDFNDDGDDTSFEACKSKLKRWANAVALTKGVQVRNFTTSFADGKAFEAIIDEYESYITPSLQQTGGKLSLQDRLINLGCSIQFSRLFANSHQGHIFDRDFVLAALVFLCSRLLAPSQQSRAAIVIQRAWRKHWTSIEDIRKLEKRKIAIECADIVNWRAQSAEDRGMLEEKPLIELTQISKLSPGLNDTHPLLSPSKDDIWLTL